MRLLRFRSLIVPVALAVTVLVAAAQPASPATAPTATCEQIALHLRSGSEDGYRIVLGRVGIPDEQPRHIRVGGRSTTVRLGVGRACGAGH